MNLTARGHDRPSVGSEQQMFCEVWNSQHQLTVCDIPYLSLRFSVRCNPPTIGAKATPSRRDPAVAHAHRRATRRAVRRQHRGSPDTVHREKTRQLPANQHVHSTPAFGRRTRKPPSEPKASLDPGCSRPYPRHFVWVVQVFTAKRLYPGAQGQPRFAASPWVHDGPARNGRAQDNDTHRRSTSPQQTAVCLSPRVTPHISVSEHAGVAHDLRLDRRVMRATLTQGAPPTTASQRCPASTGLWGTTASR